jgi:hypothetical protein
MGAWWGEKLFFPCWYIGERYLSSILVVATDLIMKGVFVFSGAISENLPCLFLGKVSQKSFQSLLILRMTMG